MELPDFNVPLTGRPQRPAGRIDDLLGLLAEDWKRSGTDLRFFQYVDFLRQRLGQDDPFYFEDAALIQYLRGQSASE